jgi:hypothetical protein
MKRTTLTLTLATLLFTVACSKVQPTTILTEKWETGQHRQCVYGHQHLYCFQVEELPVPVSKSKASLLAVMADRKFTPYFLESKRAEALKSPGTDGGVYDTKFVSHSPMDFSLWNCYKTGVGSPAISCDLAVRPTGKETALFVQVEKKQEELHRLGPAIAAHLRGLTPEDVIAACGAVK